MNLKKSQLYKFFIIIKKDILKKTVKAFRIYGLKVSRSRNVYKENENRHLKSSLKVI